MIRRFLLAGAGNLALLAVFFWWTGLSDASTPVVALSIVVAVVWIAAFLLLQRRIFAGADFNRAVARPRFWLAIVLFAACLSVAWLLVMWIPNLPGLGWQLWSAGLRLALAWALINAGWCAIAWQAALPPSEDGAAAVGRR